METLRKPPRPKHLDLTKIRLPITGVVSILHRISGVLLLLALPFFIYLLQLSVSNSAGYAQAEAILSHPLGKVVTVLLCWAIAHHFFAGIRFLLFDLDVATSKASARRAAGWVLVAEVVIVALLVIGVVL
ncbi:MAG: succinate dehydrogenase, cytochrome b556 subunit [Gammaproteobacteria bacterium]|nr:succinate dehydrogenase, cytochrome b556 subunit [Gammaproteobacteria bacterium]